MSLRPQPAHSPLGAAHAAHDDHEEHLYLRPGEPWQWPEQLWRPMVERVRAGRSLKPAAWPNGARCAVALSFDVGHETVALGEGDESPVRLSQGEYGARRGMARIRALLQREQIPATFFYPAVAALLHPDEVAGVSAEGHEVGLQGWIHEMCGRLGYQAERDLNLRAFEVVERLSGHAPAGMRTAGFDFSPNTLVIIRELGLTYDSSLMTDDDPYELMSDHEPVGLVELPPAWERNDASFFGLQRGPALAPHAAPEMVEALFRAEFEGAFAEGGVFQLTLHPQVIGRRSRIGVLQRLLAHIKARRQVWFATHEEVVRWCMEHAPAGDAA